MRVRELAEVSRPGRQAAIDRALSDRALRDRIAETLLAWLQLGENAAEVAQRIHVHPQTVRYRMRQIHELFGDQLRDPDRRFELQLALRIRTLSAGRPSDEGRSSLGSATAVADRG
jgi:DNA-binding PucR family transcriptional regulator